MDPEWEGSLSPPEATVQRFDHGFPENRLMASSGSAAFQVHFQGLTDPRVERTRKHPLINIVFLTVCGVLSGAHSFAAIHEFGLDRRQWFARFLDLTNGIPSDDTFARVLSRLDPDRGRCTWTAGRAGATPTGSRCGPGTVDLTRPSAPCLAGGMRGLTMCHWSSVRSVL